MKRNSKDKNVKQNKKSDSSKLVRTDDDINDAVRMVTSKNAIKIYGHIREWDTIK